MVTGQARGLSLGLVGWLWADLLLGLFAIFLAANSAGAVLQTPPNKGIDPTAVQLTLAIDGEALLSGDGARVVAEQERIAQAVRDQLGTTAGDRHVALVLAFAASASAADGDRLAKVATEKFTGGSFADSVVKTYHELSPADSGRRLSLEVYVYFQ